MTKETGPDIIDSLLATVPVKRAKVEFKEGIIFHLKYLPKPALNNLLKECTVIRYNDKTKSRVPTLDEDRFPRRLCAEIVEGWEGVTPRSLSKIIPVALDENNNPDQEIPFKVESLVKILKVAYEVDSFLQETATNLEFFQPAREEILGNSEPSQTGS